MKLKESQIALIEQDLRKRGISYDPLHEDLVDHICCEVEEQMAKGLIFMDAYQKVVYRFQKRGFANVNRETISILNCITMVKNFVTTTTRLFKNNLSSGLIKIFGLSIGIAVLLLSIIYAKYEYSYDRFHDEANSIYRIGRIIDRGPITTTTFPLVPALRNDFPDYRFTRFFKDRSKTLFRKNENSFFESNMIWADSYFLELFNFEGLQGDSETALSDVYSVVLTEQVALKYFERTPELGEVIEFKWNDEFYPLKITGIIPEWPPNMHISFDIIVSFKTGESIFPGGITDSWDMNYCYSYVKLPAKVTPNIFEQQFEGIVAKYVNDNEKSYKSYLGFLQPLTSIHTQSDVLSDYTNIIDPVYPKIALSIGLVVLIITAINFVTLTVVQFYERAKEVGVRKAVGASRRHVIFQFVLETFFMVAVSVIIGLMLVYLFIDPFNKFMATQLTFSMIYAGWIIFLLPFIILLITLGTGLYPAIFFSSGNIMDTIQQKKRRSAISFRKVLLTTQFLIAAVLITFTMIIFNQVHYVNAKPLGYNKDRIIYLPHGRRIRDNPEVFKTKAMSSPLIEHVSLSFYKPTDNMGYAIAVEAPGKEAVNLTVNSIDEDFFATFDIDFTEGQNFQKEGTDLTKAFIVNQAALNLLGLDDPLGATLKTEFRTGSPTMPVETREGRIIGVVKDVHFESLHHSIKPMIFIVKPYWYYFINIRLAAGDISQSIAHLEYVWHDMFPDQPFEYVFLDSEFERLYQKETKLANGLTAMAILAIVTTALGLFGYVRFITRQRTKEVGIRKVLGADLFHISQLFTREFIISILLANIISWPIAYYVSNWWLQNFAYHTEISLTPFITSLLALVLISTLTVFKEIFKVMHINPSNTLRYD